MAGTRPSILFGDSLRILVISPQPWAGFKVSKHHYAIELARLGHRVWFLEPPLARGRPGSITVEPTGSDGIMRVSYVPWFPLQLKFHARAMFDVLMRRQARPIVTAIGGPPDIVWDFDNEYRFRDLRVFGDGLCVFHPVDDIPVLSDGDKHAHVVLSVAQRFVDKIGDKRAPMHVIPHGLARAYEALARDVVRNRERTRPPPQQLCVGFVGNLDRPDMDWPVMARMVCENPAVAFRFVGPFTPATIAAFADGAAFEALRRAPNVSLDGLKPAEDVIAMARDIDIWLLCYDPARSTNAATNSHKLLEYLATGSAVLSHRIEAYAGNGLVEMPASQSNTGMPAMLSSMLGRIEAIDAPPLRARRAEYALGHTYLAHMQQISAILDEAKQSPLAGGGRRGS